jgi:hypothetical protein
MIRRVLESINERESDSIDEVERYLTKRGWEVGKEIPEETAMVGRKVINRIWYGPIAGLSLTVSEYVAADGTPFEPRRWMQMYLTIDKQYSEDSTMQLRRFSNITDPEDWGWNFANDVVYQTLSTRIGSLDSEIKRLRRHFRLPLRPGWWK